MFAFRIPTRLPFRAPISCAAREDKDAREQAHALHEIAASRRRRFCGKARAATRCGGACGSPRKTLPPGNRPERCRDSPSVLVYRTSNKSSEPHHANLGYSREERCGSSWGTGGKTALGYGQEISGVLAGRPWGSGGKELGYSREGAGQNRLFLRGIRPVLPAGILLRYSLDTS